MSDKDKPSDYSLLRTLMKRGPKEFKKEYDQYLTDKYADPDGGVGNAYAAAQSVAADLLIPDTPGEAAMAMLPIGRFGKMGKALAKESRAVKQLQKKAPAAAEKVAERTLQYPGASGAIKAERIGLQKERAALDLSTAEGRARLKDIDKELARLSQPSQDTVYHTIEEGAK